MGVRNLMMEKEVVKRMETKEESNNFITIKDHHPTVRLINPAKNELGGIKKLILDKINKKVNQKFELNEWKNSNMVID